MAKDDSYFNDLDVNKFGLGVLKGEGGESHQGSDTKTAPEGNGMGFTINCDSCGQRQTIVVSWDELIFVSAGVPPPGNPMSPAWVYQQRYGAMHPNVPCCSCGRQDTLLLLTPDEANRHLRAGEQGGRIPPGYIANARAQIAASAGRR